MPTMERVLGILLAIAVLLTFVGVIYFVLSGGIEKIGLKSLRRRFSGLTLRDAPRPNDVYLRYHTYRGLLVWCIQEEHPVYASARDAEELLRRLLWFNLTWGLLGYGLLFVPFLATGNYVVQRRSIKRQQER